MISPISGSTAVSQMVQASQPHPPQSSSNSSVLPEDTVTLGHNGQAQSSGDVDHDGDSH